MPGFLEIATTPAVRAVQETMGSAVQWRNVAGRRAFTFDRFTEHETDFIAARDSFYIATVSETGWPYVQHRGGPAGFLKVLDERTLAFADFTGNRQYISTGNATANPRGCLFLMDYARRARLKIFVEIDIVPLDADPALAELVITPGYKGRPERLYRLRVQAFDWNCPQHITPHYTEQQVTAAVQPLRDRLATLESDNAALRARLNLQEKAHDDTR
jgi:predicted pyridoxine 5'-phosphate oxidase superfamily flavin-nucleotide-binding protein